MLRTLPFQLNTTAQSLSGKLSTESSPSASCLTPAELAQAYRAWYFGADRAQSRATLRRRALR